MKFMAVHSSDFHAEGFSNAIIIYYSIAIRYAVNVTVHVKHFGTYVGKHYLDDHIGGMGPPYRDWGEEGRGLEIT